MDNTHNDKHKIMGQTKKIAEELTLDEIIAHLFSNKDKEDDFEYELFKEREEERFNREMNEHFENN